MPRFGDSSGHGEAMQQIFLVDSAAEHFTDEQSFRLKLPDLAQLVDSQLPRRSLTPENCAFEYAHKGRLKNSLGQVCTFQASFRTGRKNGVSLRTGWRRVKCGRFRYSTPTRATAARAGDPGWQG